MSNYQKILKSTATYGTNKPYVKSQTSSSASPLTTKGDVYTFSTSGARLAVGSNGQVLQADSTEDTGLKWVTSTSSNYYVDTIAFNTGNGVLTLGRVTLSDLTVDLDGRYLLSASALTSPLTTKGDVWVFGTANTRLAVGTDGYALVADSSTATGLNWAANSDANYYTSSVAMGTNGILTGTIAGGGSNWTSTAFNVITDGQIAYGQSTSGLTTGSANLTYDGTNLSLAADTDVTATIGRAFIGYNFSNYASFSHYDQRANTGGYALLQKDDGTTYLNAKSGMKIYLREENSTKFMLDGNHFRADQTNGASMRNEVPSGTNPVFTFNNDVDTGMGRAAADTLSFITEGRETVRMASDANYTKLFIGGDSTLGFYRYSNRMDFYISSSPRLHLDASKLYSETSGGPLLDLTPTAGEANYGFVDDADSGLTRSAANTIHLLTAGVSGMTMDSSQNVGIGTTSPDDLLHVEGGDVDPSIKLENNRSGHNGYYLMEHRGSSLKLQSSGSAVVPMTYLIQNTEMMRLNDTGLGIGTTAPTHTLEVIKDVASSYAAKIYNAHNSGKALWSKGGIRLEDNGYSKWWDISSDSAANFDLKNTGGTTHLYMLSGGNLGLYQGGYTADPAHALHIIGDDNSSVESTLSAFSATDDKTSKLLLQKSSNSTAGSHTLVTASDQLGQINFQGSDGDSFETGAQINAIVTQDWSASARGTDLAFHTVDNSTTTLDERMRITQAGNVGIGTTSPEGVLHTANNSGVNIFQRSNDSASYGTNLYVRKSRGTVGSESNTQSGDLIGQIAFSPYYGDYDNFAASISSAIEGTVTTDTTPGRLMFSTAAAGANTVTERMRITSAGKVGIGTTAPNVELHVNGDGRFEEDHKLYFSDSATNVFIRGASSDLELHSGDDIHLYATDDIEFKSDDLVIRDADNNVNAVFNGGDNALILGGGSTTVNGAPLQVSAGAGNLIANFDSTDGISEIRLRDNVGNGSEKYTRLLSVGNQLKLMPGDGYELMILDGSNKDVEVSGSFQLTNGAITSNPGTNHLWASGATLFWGGSQLGTTTPGAGAIEGTATAGQVSYGDGSNSITSTSNFTFTDNDGMTITTATSNKPTLMLKNTNTDGGAGELQFYKSTTSEGDGDAVGRINFYADNDAAQKTQYARIRGISQDMSDGTEDGRIEFATMQGGTLTGMMELGYDGNGNSMNLFIGAAGNTGLGAVHAPDNANFYWTFGSDLSYTEPVSGDRVEPPMIFRSGSPNPNVDSGGDSQLFIQSQDDLVLMSGRYSINGGGNDIVFKTSNTAHHATTEAMRIKGDGKVGIGTSSPTADLDVRGSSSAGMAAFVSGTGNGTYPVMHVIDSADTEVAWFEGNRAGDTGAYIGVRHWPASATENARSGIKFQSKDDGGNLTNYASILMRINDYTNGTEDGTLRFNVMADGTETEELKIDKTGLYIDTYTRLQRNSSTNGLHLTDSGGNAVSFSTVSGSNGGLRLDNTTANAIYRGSGVSFWDSTESYRLQGNSTSGYLQLDMNKITLVRSPSSTASSVLQIGDSTTYDQFSILEDARGSNATNGYLKLRAKKTGNDGYAKISLGAISGSTTSELLIDSISTNEALRFDTNSKSHALDIAKAGYVSIGAAVSTTDALYVNGNTTINGVLSATAKSFNIPHPLYKDKRLVHGSLEGPEHGIYIRGTIEASNGGLIELPEYWSAMCKDYTVQLTPHGPYTVFIEQKQMDKIMVGCTVKDFKFDYYIVGARTDQTLEVVKNA